MKIVPFIVTYNGGATGPCITRCVEYLTAEGPASFGTAIERIDIYVRCQTRDPITPGLEFMVDRFQAGLATLPFIRFRRNARLFALSYASEWVHSSEMFGASKIELSPPIPLPLPGVCRHSFIGTAHLQEIGQLRRGWVRGAPRNAVLKVWINRRAPTFLRTL